MAKEEIQTTFYGDLEKHFYRSVRIQVNGRQMVRTRSPSGTAEINIPQVEVSFLLILVCFGLIVGSFLTSILPQFRPDSNYFSGYFDTFFGVPENQKRVYCVAGSGCKFCGQFGQTHKTNATRASRGARKFLALHLLQQSLHL